MGFDTCGFVRDPESEPAAVGVVGPVLCYADRIVAFGPLVCAPDTDERTLETSSFNPSVPGGSRVS